MLAETNSNYANVLTVWDRIFGTFTSSERAYSVVYGLDDADPARIASFPALLAMPFALPDEVSVSDTNVRHGAATAR
jgi:sterol desaturase/sphingolipid hydroxylase (fatty acid hydroxylase superfamily)